MSGASGEGLALAANGWHKRGMKNTAAYAAIALLAAPLGAAEKSAALAPGEIVASAPSADWAAIPASDLLLMELAPDAKRHPRRVVIQLMPAPFSQGWIGNIRKLAAAQWWDGTSVNRVQDNYVVQWGDADGEDAKKARALPSGLAVVPESEYATTITEETSRALDVPITSAFFFCPHGVGREEREACAETIMRTIGRRDPYSELHGFYRSFPFAFSSGQVAWPVHCYGMVGVGRNLSPDTGSGAELYVVIGHAPRHLDRNIALVGRVIEGIEHLSSLPRGTGGLGFYETAEERVPIRSIRLASEMEVDPLPRYEYLSTQSKSFAAYADARANRRDPFFIRPAGGADICNIPVPVRRVKP